MAKSSSKKKGLRRWLWLLGSVIVLGLIFYHLRRSPEWKRFRWDELWATVVHARPGLLLLALVAMSATYVVRAYRWKCFLDPIKKAPLWVVFVGQILGFSSIYLIGRVGEFVRPAYIARKVDVPFTAVAAIWLLERVFDMAYLMLFFAATLSLAHINPAASHGDALLRKLHGAGRLLPVLTVLTVGGLILFRLRAEVLTGRLSRAFRWLPGRGSDHVERFLRSFADGLKVIQSWPDFLASLASTVALWSINTTVFWLIFRALGGGLERLTWMAAALVMIFAALGLAVQIPGVGGGYPVFATLALTQGFSIRPETATGAGILVWILMSVPCTALGVVLLIYEGLTFRRLAEIAEQDRAASETTP